MAYLRARIELLLFIASAVLLLGGGAAWLLGWYPVSGMFWAVCSPSPGRRVRFGAGRPVWMSSRCWLWAVRCGSISHSPGQ